MSPQTHKQRPWRKIDNAAQRKARKIIHYIITHVVSAVVSAARSTVLLVRGLLEIRKRFGMTSPGKGHSSRLDFCEFWMQFHELQNGKFAELSTQHICTL